MNVSYVYQSAQVGEFRPAVLTGSGPSSYSQTNGDVVYNAATSEYLSVVNACVTKSGTYTLLPRPTTTGQVRAGAPSATQSGWTWHWYTTAGMTEVSNAVDLSAEVVQFSALVTQL